MNNNHCNEDTPLQANVFQSVTSRPSGLPHRMAPHNKLLFVLASELNEINMPG